MPYTIPRSVEVDAPILVNTFPVIVQVVPVIEPAVPVVITGKVVITISSI